jgi:hypothetical protein
MANRTYSARLTSIWIGGLFYWIITGFKGTFDKQFIEKYENRNFWTGFALTMLVLVVVIFILVKMETAEQHGESDKTINKSPTNQLIKKDNLNEELKGIMEEYTGMYNKPFYIDTSYVVNSDTIHFLLKHYCLMDSAIEVPDKYVGIYQLHSFITHNFETIIKIHKNGKQFIEERIVKTDFDKYLHPDLKKFGVLLYPEIRYLKDSIELGYSISVPLTDVGVGLRAVINKNGSINFLK